MRRLEAATPRRVDVPGSGDSIDTSTVGGRIAWSRLRKGFSQEEVASRINNCRATVVQYESNKISPPITKVRKLADVLSVSPEFIAFGKQGLEGVGDNAAEEIITVPEMSYGKDTGLWNSNGFAFPRKVIEGYGVDPAKAKLYVLNNDAPEFGFRVGDRLIVDTEFDHIVSGRDQYLLEVDTGLEVVRREPGIGAGKGKVSVTTSKGQRLVVNPKDLAVIGPIVASLAANAS